MPTDFTPEEWSRIEAILDDVLDLEPAARAEALDRACAGDAILRARLDALVAADSGAAQFLDTPAMEYTAGWSRRPPRTPTTSRTSPAIASGRTG